MQVRTLGNETVANRRTNDTCRRQRTHVRKQRLPWAIKRERRIDLRRLNIRRIKRRNRPNIGPISLVQMRRNSHLAYQTGNDLATKVIVGTLQTRLEQFAIEHVNAHTRQIPPIVGIQTDFAAKRFGRTESLDDLGILRLLDELLHHPFFVDAQKPHPRRIFSIDQINRQRQPSLFRPMTRQHLRIIHAIKVVARQYERLFTRKMPNMV